MLIDGFPQYGNTRWQAFGPQQDTTTTRGWQTWLKPIGAQWIFIFAVGGGGGGSGGGSTAAAARVGGGGGGATGAANLLLPACMVPDVLYVRAGNGGAGGAAAASGTAGTASYLALVPSTSSGIILQGNGGNPGLNTNVAGSSPGGTLGSFALYGMGQASTQALGGSTGGVNTGAGGGSLSANSLFSGGAGGASSGTGNNVFAGGGILGIAPGTGPALSPFIGGGAAGVSGTTAGGAGSPGYNYGLPIKDIMSRAAPMIFTGGGGGGSGGASLGGKGGNGAWGCGGGGGGAGSTGGAGGNGGDGFVIIGAF